MFRTAMLMLLVGGLLIGTTAWAQEDLDPACKDNPAYKDMHTHGFKVLNRPVKQGPARTDAWFSSGQSITATTETDPDNFDDPEKERENGLIFFTHQTHEKRVKQVVEEYMAGKRQGDHWKFLDRVVAFIKKDNGDDRICVTCHHRVEAIGTAQANGKPEEACPKPCSNKDCHSVREDILVTNRDEMDPIAQEHFDNGWPVLKPKMQFAAHFRCASCHYAERLEQEKRGEISAFKWANGKGLYKDGVIVMDEVDKAIVAPAEAAGKLAGSEVDVNYLPVTGALRVLRDAGHDTGLLTVYSPRAFHSTAYDPELAEDLEMLEEFKDEAYDSFGTHAILGMRVAGHIPEGAEGDAECRGCHEDKIK